MIYFFIVLLGIISIIDIKFAKSDKFFDDYLDQTNTNSIKGIFVVMIFNSHYASELGLTPKDKSGSIILDLFGQRMVSMFLFYSGIGIMESIKKKGKNYSNKLILKVIIFQIKYATMLTFTFFIDMVINPKAKLNFKFLLSQYFHLDFHYQRNWFLRTYIAMIFYSFIGFLLYFS